MNDFVAFAERSIPFDVLLPSIGVMSVVFLLIFAARLKYRRRWVTSALLGEYVFLVLWSTVIRRIGRDGGEFKLMPYWNFNDLVLGKDPLDFVEIGLNIVLFVPVGFLLEGICTRRKIWEIALIGCGMSVAIEVLQLVFRCGLCETNDVIHNTIGCGMGAWMAVCLLKGKRKFEIDDNK